MHARYYYPTYSRFTSTDPIGGDLSLPQSWNLYAYVLNNPVRFVDPYGLDEIARRCRAQSGVSFESKSWRRTGTRHRPDV